MMVSYEKDLGDLIDIDDAFLTNCRYLNLDEDVQAAGKILGNSMKVAHLNIHSIPNKMEDLADLLDILKDRQLPYQHAHIGPMYGFTSAHFAIVGPTLARHWASYVLAISICSALGRCWANAPVQYLPSLGPMSGRY